jgi:hypothetical protein
MPPAFAIDMRKQVIWSCGLAGAVLLSFGMFQARTDETPALFEPAVRSIEAAPLCPWRDPEADLRTFFPGATRYVDETRILSGQRVELAQRLGRLPEAEENALLSHRVFAGSECLGFILTRRVKGEYGAIEIVLAVSPRGEVEGVSLQRWREPEAIAHELRNPEWLQRFRGRTQARGWDGDDLRRLPEEARVSARAVREGVRGLLALQAAAQSSMLSHR